MKTILVVAGHTTRKGIPIEQQAPLPTESLGLAYLASAIEAAGFEVVVLDGYDREWTVDETVAQLLAIVEPQDLVGFSVTHAALGATKRAVDRLRRSGFEGTILLGGWEATLAPAGVLAQVAGANWVLRGEGEVALPLIIRRLADGQLLEELPGLIGQKQAAAPSIVNVVDFASLAPPRHHTLREQRPLPIQSSRGCAYGTCRFCATPAATGRRWRGRGVDQLVAELARDLELRRANERVFVDDEFLGPSVDAMGRAAAFADALIAARLQLRLTIDCRVADYEPALFDKLRRAGVKRIFLGIESGSDGVLRRLAKGYSAKTARRTLRQLRADGFEIIPGYLLFEPFMTLGELRAAFDFLVQEVTPLTPTKFLNKVVPYAGTPLHDQVASAGLFRGSYPDLGHRFADPVLERFYDALTQQARGIVDDYKRALGCVSAAERAAATASCVQQMIRLFDRLLCQAGV